MMNNDIEKSSIIKRTNLDERFYFQSLINEAFTLNMIDTNFLSTLQLQSFELLRLRVERYNGFDSTSILKDKASSIMESNIYTIGLFLKKVAPDEAIEKLKTNTMTDIYNKGRREIDRKLDICRVLYKKVLSNKVNTDNMTYNDTIIGGIKAFFKIYEPDFDATNIKITADYPLYNNLIGILDGIEFMQEYLTSLDYENEFCNVFSENRIKYLLYGYSHDYKNLLINIFEIILIAVMGCILANEDVFKLTISSSGLQKIYNKMQNQTKEEVDTLIKKTYSELKRILIKENLELQKYIEKGLTQVQFQVYNAVRTNTLDKIFIIEKFIE